MKLKKQNAVTWAVALVLVAVVLGGAWWWRIEERRATIALAMLRQKTQEREYLLACVPSVTEANETALAADLMRAREKLGELKEILRSSDSDDEVREGNPVQSVELYFKIASDLEELRARSEKVGVAIKHDEAFGLSAYQREGPESEVASMVFQQCALLKQLVERLIEAKPQSIVSVKREAPYRINARESDSSTIGAQAITGTLGRTVTSPDYFEMDSRLTTRIPDKLRTRAFRFEFVGPTAALRDFLGAVARESRVFAVRSVEVEPLDKELGNGRADADTEKQAFAPIVSQVVSRFVVIVEFIMLQEFRAARIFPDAFESSPFRKVVGCWRGSAARREWPDGVGEESKIS